MAKHHRRSSGRPSRDRCQAGHAWRVLSIRRGANMRSDCGTIVEDVAVMSCIRCHTVGYEPAGPACSCTTCGCACQTFGQVPDCDCGCPGAGEAALRCGCSCERLCPPEHDWLCDRCGAPVNRDGVEGADYHETARYGLVHADCASVPSER